MEVISSPSELSENDESEGVGWKAAYAFTMEILLHEHTVMREAKKLNDENIYTVGVYQFGPRMFFTAYHAETCSRHYISIPTTEINKLLPPNSFEITTSGWMDPPGRTNLSYE